VMYSKFCKLGNYICTQGMIKISSGDSIGEYGAVSHGWRTQRFNLTALLDCQK